MAEKYELRKHDPYSGAVWQPGEIPSGSCLKFSKPHDAPNYPFHGRSSLPSAVECPVRRGNRPKESA